MSEAEEEDAIGGTCESKEIEIFVGSEGKRHKNGNGSSVPGDDNSYLPPFNDDIALVILARLPSSKYCDLRLVNRRFRSLIRSVELNKIRKKIGLKEPKVFFLPSSVYCYCYEPYTRSCWALPVCPTTASLVGKPFCLGTHLFILGIIPQNINLQNSSHSDIWRYELESNRWFNGPMMTTPRFFFAFADCGSVSCIAGGEHQVSEQVLNSAEKYNPESKSWEPLLPSMIKQRNFCSGFYMDSKFYVISGRNENHDLLTCGECYDFERNVWELIPNMIEYYSVTETSNTQLPNLISVVNNELYYLEFPSRHLKVYLKNNNTWKKVGRMPASIEHLGCWRVELKSLGNELLLIGRTWDNPSTAETVLCFCTPSPKLDDVEWHVLDINDQGRNLSFYKCCVMMV